MLHPQRGRQISVSSFSDTPRVYDNTRLTLMWKRIRHGTDEEPQQYMVVSGKWQDGKLNDQSCQVYFNPGGIHSFDQAETSPLLTLNISNNRILNGQASVVDASKDKTWKFTFDSLVSHDTQIHHNYFSRDFSEEDPEAGTSYIKFSREYVFNQAVWKFGSGLDCSGQFVARKIYSFRHKHEPDPLYYLHQRMRTTYEFGEFELKLFDLLSLFSDSSQFKLATGDVSYIGSCPLRYELKVSQELQRIELTESMTFQVNERVLWQVGDTVTLTQAPEEKTQHKVHVYNINEKSNLQPVELLVEISSIRCNEYQMNLHDQQEHSTHSSSKILQACSFGSKANSCWAKYLSFLPCDYKKLSEFLKKNDASLKNVDFDSLSVQVGLKLKLQARWNLCPGDMSFDITSNASQCEVRYRVDETHLKPDKKTLSSGILFKAKICGPNIPIGQYLEKLGADEGRNERLVVWMKDLQDMGLKFTLKCNVESCKRIFDRASKAGFEYISKFLKDFVHDSSFPHTATGIAASLRLGTWYMAFLDDGEFFEKLFQSGSSTLISSVLRMYREQTNSQRRWWEEFRTSVQDNQQWNVLHYAAYLNDAALLKVGKDHYYEAIRNVSRKKGDLKKLAKLEGWFLFTDISGNLPIHIAAQYGNVVSVRSLLEWTDYKYQREITQQTRLVNNEGWLPIALAAINDHAECVMTLIKYHRSWENINLNGFTFVTLLALNQAWKTMQCMAHKTDAAKIQVWEKRDEYGMVPSDYFDSEMKTVCAKSAPTGYKLIFDK